jgi:hypothetical protein
MVATIQSTVIEEFHDTLAELKINLSTIQLSILKMDCKIYSAILKQSLIKSDIPEMK